MLLLMIMRAAACRDAKSFVSRWRSEYVASVLSHAYVGMEGTGDARFCVSTLV